MLPIIPALLTIIKYLENLKKGSSVHYGGSIIPVSWLLEAIYKFRNLFVGKTGKGVSETGKSVSLAQYNRAVKTLKDAKIGSGISIPVRTGGFVFTIPVILAMLTTLASAAGGSAAIAKTVLDNQKNNKELEEQKRHNLAMESKSGSGLRKKKQSRGKSCLAFK